MRDPEGILERKMLVKVLIDIYESPGQAISELTQIGESRWRTKYMRLHELKDMGLVHFDNDPRRHNTIFIYLTPKGQELASILQKATKIIESIPETTESDETPGDKD